MTHNNDLFSCLLQTQSLHRSAAALHVRESLNVQLCNMRADMTGDARGSEPPQRGALLRRLHGPHQPHHGPPAGVCLSFAALHVSPTFHTNQIKPVESMARIELTREISVWWAWLGTYGDHNRCFCPLI
jgi:hypothetical protein